MLEWKGSVGRCASVHERTGHSTPGGWKLETFSNKWLKECGFGTGAVKSPAGLVNWMVLFGGMTLSFRSRLSLTYLFVFLLLILQDSQKSKVQGLTFLWESSWE